MHLMTESVVNDSIRRNKKYNCIKEIQSLSFCVRLNFFAYIGLYFGDIFRPINNYLSNRLCRSRGSAVFNLA
jgi:hypothetical protein